MSATDPVYGAIFRLIGFRFTHARVDSGHSLELLKLAFHDTDTDTDISGGSSRECRRVVQLVAGITSGNRARVGRVGEDPREDVRVVVGVVECGLYT